VSLVSDGRGLPSKWSSSLVDDVDLLEAVVVAASVWSIPMRITPVAPSSPLPWATAIDTPVSSGWWESGARVVVIVSGSAIGI